MESKKVQIFPFFLQEGKQQNDVPDPSESPAIFRSMLLDRHQLNPKDWFFTDNSTLDEIVYWNYSGAKNDLIQTGIEFSKSEFKKVTAVKKPKNQTLESLGVKKGNAIFKKVPLAKKPDQ